MTASDENIYSLNGKTSRGIELPTLWNIFTIMAFHRQNQLAYYVFFITFLTYVYLHTTGPYLDSFSFTLPRFYIIFTLCFFVSFSFT